MAVLCRSGLAARDQNRTGSLITVGMAGPQNDGNQRWAHHCNEQQVGLVGGGVGPDGRVMQMVNRM